MRFFFSILLLCIAARSEAQFRTDTLAPPPRQEIDWGRVGIATGVLAASITGLHILQNNSWWANDRGPFHIQDDPGYENNFDKFGHAFGGYYTSFFFSEAFAWTGMANAQATLLG